MQENCELNSLGNFNSIDEIFQHTAIASYIASYIAILFQAKLYNYYILKCCTIT